MQRQLHLENILKVFKFEQLKLHPDVCWYSLLLIDRNRMKSPISLIVQLEIWIRRLHEGQLKQITLVFSILIWLWLRCDSP